MSALKPGTRLRSAVCTTEVVVVAVAGEPDLRCGGSPMTPIVSGASRVGDQAAPAPAFAAGTKLGKRYVVDGDVRLEVLCTKAGAGSLSVGDNPLSVKASKKLPSSD